MARTSAGLVVFRVGPARAVEVLIVHPGGPIWARRDAGAWSIPKGEVEAGEDPEAVAVREFAEELGRPVPAGPRTDLGSVRQRGGKIVLAWAVAGDLDVSVVRSNTFELAWPPGSGRTSTFPEVDRAAWETVAVARQKLLVAQAPFLDRLMALARHHPAGGPTVVEQPDVSAGGHAG